LEHFAIAIGHHELRASSLHALAEKKVLIQFVQDLRFGDHWRFAGHDLAQINVEVFWADKLASNVTASDSGHIFARPARPRRA
jgi:hypothetical protein